MEYKRRKDFDQRKEVADRDVKWMLWQNELIVFSVAALLAIAVYFALGGA